MDRLFHEEILIPLVAIVSGCLVGGAAILASVWYKLRVKQWEMSLKHSMLERGMSAEEIKMVLETSAKEAPGKGCWNFPSSTGKHA